MARAYLQSTRMLYHLLALALASSNASVPMRWPDDWAASGPISLRGHNAGEPTAREGTPAVARWQI
jgi:hypothetical protein